MYLQAKHCDSFASAGLFVHLRRVYMYVCDI